MRRGEWINSMALDDYENEKFTSNMLQTCSGNSITQPDASPSWHCENADAGVPVPANRKVKEGQIAGNKIIETLFKVIFDNIDELYKLIIDTNDDIDINFRRLRPNVTQYSLSRKCQSEKDRFYTNSIKGFFKSNNLSGDPTEEYALMGSSWFEFIKLYFEALKGKNEDILGGAVQCAPRVEADGELKEKVAQLI